MSEYFVSISDGDDDNVGSVGEPFETIRRALDLVGAGDTIYIREGTYPEAISVLDGAIIGGNSWATRLLITAYPGESVILQPLAGASRVVFLPNANTKYIVFQDLVFDAVNCSTDCVKITYSGDVEYGVNSAHHIMFLRCTAKNSIHNGVLITGSEYNAWIQGEVYDNGTSSLFHGFYITCPHNVVRGVKISGNYGNGVVCYHGPDAITGEVGVDYNAILENQVWDNSIGITLSSGIGNLARFNTVWENQYGVVTGYSAINNRFLDNVLYNNAVDDEAFADATHIGTVMDNTILV